MQASFDEQTCGMDAYALACPGHIPSRFYQPLQAQRNPVHPHSGNLHDGAALFVDSSGVPAEALLVPPPASASRVIRSPARHCRQNRISPISMGIMDRCSGIFMATQ